MRSVSEWIRHSVIRRSASMLSRRCSRVAVRSSRRVTRRSARFWDLRMRDLDVTAEILLHRVELAADVAVEGRVLLVEHLLDAAADALDLGVELGAGALGRGRDRLLARAAVAGIVRGRDAHRAHRRDGGGRKTRGRVRTRPQKPGQDTAFLRSRRCSKGRTRRGGGRGGSGRWSARRPRSSSATSTLRPLTRTPLRLRSSRRRGLLPLLVVDDRVAAGDAGVIEADLRLAQRPIRIQPSSSAKVSISPRSRIARW